MTTETNTNASYLKESHDVTNDDLIETFLNFTTNSADTVFDKVNSDIERLLEIGLNGITTLVIIILGLIGNSLTIFVTSRQKMRSASNCYIIGLAVWDTSVLVNTLFLIVLPLLSEKFSNTVFPYIVVYIYPLALVSQTATLWITFFFTVERFIAVFHPLRAKTLCTVSKARMIIIAVSILSFLFNLCRWFEYEVQIENQISKGRNMSQITFKYTKLGSDPIFQQAYFIWFYSVIMFIVPILSLAVLNTLLTKKLRESDKQRRKMSLNQLNTYTTNVTKLSVAVVTVFMTCHIPALVYNVTYAVDINYVKSELGWRILSIVRNFLIPFNSAVNFILFCALGENFQKTFKKTFSFCFKHDNLRRYSLSQGLALTSINGTWVYDIKTSKKFLDFKAGSPL